MSRKITAGMTKASLKRWLLLFFLALFIPSLILVLQAYRQLKWESFHQYSVQADKLIQRIDLQLKEVIAKEEKRAFTDYSFLIVSGDTSANFVQRSPLSEFPDSESFPGLLGYFQVDADGRFSTPLLPPSGTGYELYGISSSDLKRRLDRQNRLHQILSENQLVRADTPEQRAIFVEAEAEPSGRVVAPLAESALEEIQSDDAQDLDVPSTVSESTRPDAQLAFDRLSQGIRPDESNERSFKGKSLGRVDQLKLDYSYQQQAKSVEKKQLAKMKAEVAMAQAPQPAKTRPLRKERSLLAEPKPAAVPMEGGALLQQPEVRVRIFEGEIDGFQLSLLDSGHFVLYRNVWRSGRRYIQGALLEQDLLLQGIVNRAFRTSTLSDMSNLIVAYDGEVIQLFNGGRAGDYLAADREFQGEVLNRSRLSRPLSEVELLFTINQLPSGSGQVIVNWVAATLFAILLLGFTLLYRLAAKQLDLNKQQQDFVSAVSHELKTPLTSIRMYGEILMQGWANEEKRKEYYAYIHDESERLSRLITNVLQLARMNRHELSVELSPVPVTELIDSIQSKVSSQLERAGFSLQVELDDGLNSTSVLVDPDAFSQVVINLVDNGIKFSANAPDQRIVIAVAAYGLEEVMFKVRDFGPGIPKGQLKRIFNLFYRPNDEMTRETVGTGIGLALVHQLVTTMGGNVDVVNCDPGAEFRFTLPIAKQSS